MDPNSLAQIRNRVVASNRIGSEGRWVMSAGFLLWIVLLSIVSASRAVAGMRAGVEIGLNYSSLHYYHLDQVPQIYWDPGWRPSFTGGVTLQVPIRGRLNFATGLRYLQQGNRVKFDTGPADPTRLVGEFRVYQDYLSVPALLTWYPTTRQRFFLSLGPEIGLLLAAHSVQEFSMFPSKSFDDKDNIESINVTADAAAGYEFPMERDVETLSLHYTHGLTGVAKREDWNTGWETRGVELMFGMRW